MRAMRFAAGVHASGGFGIGGPIQPATLHPTLQEEVYVQSVMDQLHWRIQKSLAMRAVLSHFVLLVLVIALSLLRLTPKSVKGTNASIRENLFAEEEFRSLSGLTPLMEQYLPALMARCWGTRANRSSLVVALHTVAPRQLRLRSGPTSAGDVYHQSRFSASMFPYNFSVLQPYQLLDAQPVLESYLTDEPIPMAHKPGEFFYSNAWLKQQASTGTGANNISSRVYLGTSVTTSERRYPRTDKSYPIGPLLFDAIYTTEDIAQFLQPYQQGQFVSGSTACIVVDAVFFEPSEGYFFAVSATMGVEAFVRMVPFLFSHPFRVHTLAPRHYSSSKRSFDFGKAILLTVLDGLTFLAACWVLAGAIGRMQTHRTLTGSWASAIIRHWELYDVALFLLLCAMVGGHLYLVIVGSRGGANNGALESFSFLMEYGHSASLVAKIRNWTVVAVLLRTFHLLQYISRLSVVTETIRSSAQDIIGVGLIFLLLMFGFTIQGLLMYSSNFESFSSLVNAFAYFAMLVGSGDVGEYYSHEDATWTAAIYYLLFFFIAYFVLLNVIIGILAASFVTTVETFDLVKRADWSPEALRRDLVGIYRRIKKGTSLLLEDDGAVGEYIVLGAAAHHPTAANDKTVSGATNAAIVTESGAAGDVEVREHYSWEEAHLRLIQALQPLASTDSPTSNPEEECRITLSQLISLGQHVIAPRQLAILFAKSQAQVGTRNGKVRNVRLLSRRMRKGTQLMEEVAVQSEKVQQIRCAIMGKDRKQGGEEPSPPQEQQQQGGNQGGGGATSVSSSPNTSPDGKQRGRGRSPTCTTPALGGDEEGEDEGEGGALLGGSGGDEETLLVDPMVHLSQQLNRAAQQLKTLSQRMDTLHSNSNTNTTGTDEHQ